MNRQLSLLASKYSLVPPGRENADRPRALAIPKTGKASPSRRSGVTHPPLTREQRDQIKAALDADARRRNEGIPRGRNGLHEETDGIPGGRDPWFPVTRPRSQHAYDMARARYLPG